MYRLVRVGVNIGFFFGAMNELSYKQSEVPGLVKRKTKKQQQHPHPPPKKSITKEKIKKLVLFTFLEDSSKVLRNSISTSHNAG